MSAMRDIAESFCLHHQPIVDAQGNVWAYEGLLRRRDDNVPRHAEYLISQAKENCELHLIDHFVVNQTVSILNEWSSVNEDTFLTVNVSIQSFANEIFAQRLLQLLGTLSRPSRLIIELTESEKVSDALYYQVIDTLYQVKALGVRLALDDWGDGHACLKLLRLYPIDLIKFDRSVMHDITEHGFDSHCMRTMQAIFNMIKNLQIPTILEGIESSFHQRIADKLQPTLRQGFLFGKPQPLEKHGLLSLAKEISL